jgi:hypothetical protein
MARIAENVLGQPLSSVNVEGELRFEADARMRGLNGLAFLAGPRRA